MRSCPFPARNPLLRERFLPPHYVSSSCSTRSLHLGAGCSTRVKNTKEVVLLFLLKSQPEKTTKQQADCRWEFVLFDRCGKLTRNIDSIFHTSSAMLGYLPANITHREQLYMKDVTAKLSAHLQSTASPNYTGASSDQVNTLQ